MQPLIEKLRAGLDLNSSEIAAVMPQLLADATEDSIRMDFLAALHRKGETVEEITGFVQLLADQASDPGLDEKNLPGPLIDVSGTGGDKIDLFNVSTTVAFILAAGGAVVAKHGNHRVTSQCGSADVLAELGVPIDLGPNDLKECIGRLGLCFIHARRYHPVYRIIGDARVRLGRENSRDTLSILGPLLNPARPSRQLIGVYSPRLTGVMAEVLRRLGRERVWVVHGTTETGEGIDEISIGGATILAELANGKVVSGVIDSRWLNIPSGPLEELRGGNARENAAHIEGILAGEIQGPKRNLAIMNAAGGFVVGGIAHDMSEGIALAREQIESGRALERLRGLQQFREVKSR